MPASPPAATGLSTGLPQAPFGPCHHASTWLLPCCPAPMLCTCPAPILHCPRTGRCARRRTTRTSRPHSSSCSSLGSPAPWLAPQPPNPLCNSSAAQLLACGRAACPIPEEHRGHTACLALPTMCRTGRAAAQDTHCLPGASSPFRPQPHLLQGTDQDQTARPEVPVETAGAPHLGVSAHHC